MLSRIVFCVALIVLALAAAAFDRGADATAPAAPSHAQDHSQPDADTARDTFGCHTHGAVKYHCH